MSTGVFPGIERPKRGADNPPTSSAMVCEWFVPKPPPSLSVILRHVVGQTLPMPRSSEWSLALTFTHQNSVYITILPQTCHMRCPSHSSWSDHLANIWRALQIAKPLITQFSCLPLPPTFRHKYRPQRPVLEHLLPVFLTLVWKPQVPHPYKTIIKIMFLYFLITRPSLIHVTVPKVYLIQYKFCLISSKCVVDEEENARKRCHY
jgi:hypothetical protein